MNSRKPIRIDLRMAGLENSLQAIRTIDPKGKLHKKLMRKDKAYQDAVHDITARLNWCISLIDEMQKGA